MPVALSTLPTSLQQFRNQIMFSSISLARMIVMICPGKSPIKLMSLRHLVCRSRAKFSCLELNKQTDARSDNRIRMTPFMI